MQDPHIEFITSHISDRTDQRHTVTIRMRNWHEKIIAHYAQDDRLQAVLEQEADFYERIAALCVSKSIDSLNENELQLGELLAKAGCGMYGKRFISRLSGISPLQAQKLLNKFYEIFYKTKAWLHKGNQEFSFQVVRRLLDKSEYRCSSNLPLEWQYLSELTFSIPSYTYSVQAEKFFKHYFENELEINGELVSLPIEVVIG